MNSLARRAAGATWWSVIEITSRYGVQMVVTIILARLLTPSDFGLIAMLLVFTTLGALLVDSGFGTALIQRRDLTPDDETTVFVFATLSGLVLGALLWLCAPLVADFYREPQLVRLTRLVAWILPLGGLAAVPDALLTRHLLFQRRTHAQVIASLTSGTLAVILAFRGHGVWSIAWQSVAAMAVRTMCLWAFARWWPAGRFQTHAFRRLFGFGGFMLLARMVDAFYTRAQALLLGRLFNASTLGYYTLAQNAQQAPANFMSTVLNRVGLPVFSELADRPDRLRAGLRMTLRVSLFFFLPCMLGLAAAAGPLIVFVYGDKWQPAAPILTLLALATAFWPLHVLNLAALTAQGRSDLLLRLELVKKSAGLLIVVIASPFGPIAVAFAVLISSVLGLIVNAHYTRKLLGYGVREQLYDQRLTLLACTLAALPAWLILHWTRAGLGNTLAAILAAALVYLVLTHVFRSPALKDMKQLLRSLKSSSHEAGAA